MNKPIGKLLAVAFAMTAGTASADAPRSLASGAPACGNTNTKGPSMCQRAERNLQFARAELVRALDEERIAASLVVDQPRVLASGAPACGNTGGKGEMECTTADADRIYDGRVQRLVRAGAAVMRARAQVVAAEKRWAPYANLAIANS
jgi:hypothetical protein